MYQVLTPFNTYSVISLFPIKPMKKGVTEKYKPETNTNQIRIPFGQCGRGHRSHGWLVYNLPGQTVTFEMSSGNPAQSYRTDMKWTQKNVPARSFELLHTYKSHVIFVKQSLEQLPRSDMKPFAHQLCRKKRNPLGKRRCAVDSETSWKVRKTSQHIREVKAHVNPHNQKEFLVPRSLRTLPLRSSNMASWFLSAFIHNIKHTT